MLPSPGPSRRSCRRSWRSSRIGLTGTREPRPSRWAGRSSTRLRRRQRPGGRERLRGRATDRPDDAPKYKSVSVPGSLRRLRSWNSRETPMGHAPCSLRWTEAAQWWIVQNAAEPRTRRNELWRRPSHRPPDGLGTPPHRPCSTPPSSVQWLAGTSTSPFWRASPCCSAWSSSWSAVAGFELVAGSSAGRGNAKSPGSRSGRCGEGAIEGGDAPTTRKTHPTGNSQDGHSADQIS